MVKLELTRRKNTWVSPAYIGNKSIYVGHICRKGNIFYAIVIDQNDASIADIKHGANFTSATKILKRLLTTVGVKFQEQIRKTI